MSYQFTYLYMGLTFLAIWLILFFYRKDTRKELVIVSSVFALGGPIMDILFTQDWWNPQTITNTVFSFESILTGFAIAGVASVIYEDIFKKQVKIRQKTKQDERMQTIHVLLLLALSATVFFGSFYAFGLNSLYATIFAFVLPSIIMWIQRPDLMLDSFATGIILIGVASIVYTVLHFLTPGWVETFWVFSNTPKIMFLNLPLDDIIWYFAAGLFFGPIYEFWQEGRLIDTK